MFGKALALTRFEAQRPPGEQFLDSGMPSRRAAIKALVAHPRTQLPATKVRPVVQMNKERRWCIDPLVADLTQQRWLLGKFLDPLAALVRIERLLQCVQEVTRVVVRILELSGCSRALNGPTRADHF